MEGPNPLHIMQVATGHWPARTLQVAVHLGLFTPEQRGDRVQVTRG